MAFPILRFFIAILFLQPVLITNNMITEYLLPGVSEPLLTIIRIIKSLILIYFIFYMYGLYTRKIEKRTAYELGREGALKEFMTGLLIGGGMVLFIVIIFLLLGYYSVDAVNSPIIIISRIFRYAQGAFLEDLIFTVILFRLVEELSNTKVAYIFSCLIFGFMHLLNENSSVLTSLSISLMQITLLAPFILTRRIWMVWAVHFGWNFFQTGFFGFNNSGLNQGGFLTATINGPDWMTGATFGLEASILAVVVNLVVGIPILFRAIKNKQVI